MIDVESIIAAEEIRKQALAVEQIRDVGMKWLSGHPPAQKHAIEQLAVNFLLTTVAMRMLAQAEFDNNESTNRSRLFSTASGPQRALARQEQQWPSTKTRRRISRKPKVTC